MIDTTLFHKRNAVQSRYNVRELIKGIQLWADQLVVHNEKGMSWPVWRNNDVIELQHMSFCVKILISWK